jgi:hypothetical protein
MLDEALGRFRETVLEISAGAESVSVDLRQAVDSRIMPFAGAPFGVITAFNPDGITQTALLNAGLDEQLEGRLKELAFDYQRATGRSPDRSHVERGFAVLAPRETLLALADEFDQLAIFWFDGSAFWIWPVAPAPIRLPT